MIWPFSKHKDIRPELIPAISWDGNSDVESLKQIYDYVARQIESAADWYLRNRRGKRICGRAIRLLAMLATTAAAVIPILVQIFATGGKPAFDPSWASISVAFAAALVSFDYFFGFSTAWMRYMETQMRIARALRELIFDWEILRLGWAGGQPTNTQILTALNRLKQAALQVQQLVEDETNAWIAEFRSSLKLIDEAAKAKQEILARAGATIIVTNGPEAVGEWTLAVDDGAVTRHRGVRAALIGLTSGVHKFRVEGTINNEPKHDEMSQLVPNSGVVEITLTLK